MSQILFYCPKCRQQLEAGMDLAGTGLECPACSESIIIPTITLHPDPEGDQVNFDCPHCGQNADAPSGAVGREVKCPNCGQPILIPGLMEDPEAEEEGNPSEPAPVGGPTALTDEPVEEEKKGSTSRIEVPESDGLPDRQIRQITIKRPTGVQTGTVSRRQAPEDDSHIESGGVPGKRHGLFGRRKG